MPDSVQKEYSDVFPALVEYQKEHTINSLKKVCIELEEFILRLYASTKSEAERDVFWRFVKKLNNIEGYPKR